VEGLGAGEQVVEPLGLAAGEVCLDDLPSSEAIQRITAVDRHSHEL
jgi:hypothetical protein